MVTDEWVLGQAGILDVVNDDQVSGQPMFSGPDFLSDHTFSEAMPSERSSATRTDDLSSNASRANRSQGRGTNRPDHDDSVSGRDDDEPGIGFGAQSSSFPGLMNIGQSEVRDSRGSSRPVPTSSIAFQVVIPNLVHPVELHLMFICQPNPVGQIGEPHGPATETFLAWISPHGCLGHPPRHLSRNSKAQNGLLEGMNSCCHCRLRISILMWPAVTSGQGRR